MDINNCGGLPQLSFGAVGYYAVYQQVLACGGWCAPGLFNNATSANACTRCPAGRFLAQAKAYAQEADCLACPHGYWSQPGSAACTACSGGTYDTGSGCAACTSGRYSSGTANTECIQCPPGTFGDANGHEGPQSCVPCPAGRFNADFGSTNCTSCAVGAYISAGRGLATDHDDESDCWSFSVDHPSAGEVVSMAPGANYKIKWQTIGYGQQVSHVSLFLERAGPEASNLAELIAYNISNTGELKWNPFASSPTTGYRIALYPFVSGRDPLPPSRSAFFEMSGQTNAPTAVPTSVPTSVPTGLPTSVPTSAPTLVPTSVPTNLPTAQPTFIPTSVPTQMGVQILAPNGQDTWYASSSYTVKWTVTGAPGCDQSNDNATILLATQPMGGQGTVLASNVHLLDWEREVSTGTVTGGGYFYVQVVPVISYCGAQAASEPVWVSETHAPTSSPTTGMPTASPTTAAPTVSPTHKPTSAPSDVPTSHPTSVPTEVESFDVVSVSPRFLPAAGAPGGAANMCFQMQFTNPDRLAGTGATNITVGGRQCAQPDWGPAAQVCCESPPGRGSGKRVVVDLGSPLAPRAINISYAVAHIASLDPPGGFSSTGGEMMTISGTNFGLASQPVPVQAHVGGKPCQSTSLWSDGTIGCVTPPGSGGDKDVLISIDGVESVAPGLFSYETPVIRYLIPSTGLRSGGEVVLIGDYIGTAEEISEGKVSLIIDGAAMPCTGSISSDTAIRCKYPPGTSLAVPVMVHLDDANATAAASSSNELEFAYAQDEQFLLRLEVVVTDANGASCESIQYALSSQLLSEAVGGAVAARLLSDSEKGFVAPDGYRDGHQPAYYSNVTTVGLAEGECRIRFAVPATSEQGGQLLNATIVRSIESAAFLPSDYPVRRVSFTGISRDLWCEEGTESRQGTFGIFNCIACEIGKFSAHNDDVCSRCPHGGDCLYPRTSLPDTLPGFWRNGRAVLDMNTRANFQAYDYHRCLWSPQEVCIGGNSSQPSCAVGHVQDSVLCTQCLASYYMHGGQCTECGNKAAIRVLVFVVGAVLALTSSAAAWVLFMRVPNPTELWDVRDASSRNSVQGASVSEEEGSIMTKAKIFISMAQVMTAQVTVFPDVPWPDALLNLVSMLDIVNLRALSVPGLAVSCLRSFSFVEGFVVSMVMPLALQLAVVLVCVGRHRFLTWIGSTPEKLRYFHDKCWQLTLFLWFLIQPSCATSALKFLYVPVSCRRRRRVVVAVVSSPRGRPPRPPLRPTRP